jgi:hypothetical protein
MKSKSIDSTTIEETGRDSVQSIDAVHSQVVQRLLDGENVADRLLIRWSDRCSPILVKETRQALKSRQFTWTFLLLMIAIIVWTFFAIISMLPGVYFFPAGKTLLIGYLVLLLIPTIVIVPNAAYHSMSSELDQGTFDVLSISPLTPMKVVGGKLAVAMVQSLIYFSALAPCIALTYLLRGVPISTIGVTLAWIALLSWVCASAGILLASINRVGVYSTVLSVFMILITLGCTIALFSSLASWISFAQPIESSALIFMCLAMVVIASYGWLMVLAASASIGVAGENYSTTIRWWALLQSTLIALVFIFGMVQFELHEKVGLSIDEEAFLALLVILAIHWGVIGTFFIGESGATSPRAQRTLPDTLLTRVFLTWTNPGSGPGYFFVLCSYAGVVAMTLFSWFGRSLSAHDYTMVAGFGLTLLGHLIVYLGTTRLILLLLPHGTKSRMIISVCLMAILVGAGSFFTLLFSYAANDFNEPSFEWYSILNVMWTYSDFVRVPELSFSFLAILAVVIFAINLQSLTQDIVLVRIQVPAKVLKERKVEEVEPVQEGTSFVDVV